VVIIAVLVSPFLQALVGRVALRFAIHTETVVDDLLIDALRPFRFVHVLPLGLAFFLVQLAEPWHRPVTGSRWIFSLLHVKLAWSISRRYRRAYSPTSWR
jgi:hypothetical protein